MYRYGIFCLQPSNLHSHDLVDEIHALVVIFNLASQKVFEIPDNQALYKDTLIYQISITSGRSHYWVDPP